MDECPSISLTIFGCTPLVRSRVAQVSLRSWNLMSGSPDLCRSGFQCLSWRLSRLIGVPRLVQNTRPKMFHPCPLAARSLSWRARCRSSASAAPEVSLMDRRLPLVFGSVRRRPPFDDYWHAEGRSGFRVWRYRLIKLPSVPTRLDVALEASAAHATPERRQTTILRLVGGRNQQEGCFLAGAIRSTPVGKVQGNRLPTPRRRPVARL